MNRPTEPTEHEVESLLADTPAPVMQIDAEAVVIGGRRRARQQRVFSALGGATALAAVATLTLVLWPPAGGTGIPADTAIPATPLPSPVPQTTTPHNPSPVTSATPSVVGRPFIPPSSGGDIVVPPGKGRPEQRFRIEEKDSRIALYEWRDGQWKLAPESSDSSHVPGLLSFVDGDGLSVHLAEVPANTVSAWAVTRTPTPANYWAGGTRLGERTFALVSASQTAPSQPGTEHSTIRDVIWQTSAKTWHSLTGDTGHVVAVGGGGVAVVFTGADILAVAACETPGSSSGQSACDPPAVVRASQGWLQMGGSAEDGGVPSTHVGFVLIPRTATRVTPALMSSATLGSIETTAVPGTTLSLVRIAGTTVKEGDQFITKLTYVDASGRTQTLYPYDETQQIDLTP